MYQRQSSRRALSGWAVGIVLLAATPLIVASGARAADGDKKVKPKVGTATSSLTDGWEEDHRVVREAAIGEPRAGHTPRAGW